MLVSPLKLSRDKPKQKPAQPHNNSHTPVALVMTVPRAHKEQGGPTSPCLIQATWRQPLHSTSPTVMQLKTKLNQDFLSNALPSPASTASSGWDLLSMSASHPLPSGFHPRRGGGTGPMLFPWGCLFPSATQQQLAKGAPSTQLVFTCRQKKLKPPGLTSHTSPLGKKRLFLEQSAQPGCGRVLQEIHPAGAVSPPLCRKGDKYPGFAQALLLPCIPWEVAKPWEREEQKIHYQNLGPVTHPGGCGMEG